MNPFGSAPLAKLSAPLHQVVNTRQHLRDQFFGPIEEQFDKFFNDFFSVQRKPSNHGFPRVDIYEYDDKFVVEYSMAGVDPEDVKVEIHDQEIENSDFTKCSWKEYGRVLKVSGKMDAAYEHRKDAVYHVKELTRKSFVRTMLLPEYVKSDPVASYHHGMLTLTFDLPKKEEVKQQVKSIPILTKEDK